MLRTFMLFTIICLWMIAPGFGAGQAASFDMAAGKGPAYAPGQVLVRFQANTPSHQVSTVLATHGVTVLRSIAPQTFTVAVPIGHEEEMVAQLLADPTIQYAMLNYRITEDSPHLSKPVGGGASAFAVTPKTILDPTSCITGLWMSVTPQGDPAPDDLFASDNPLLNAVFEYMDCDREAVRVQVYYLGLNEAPTQIFDESGLSISGSGKISVEIPAWEHFPEKGVFPVGNYLTVVSTSPEGGWDAVASSSWHVSIFANDHWFRGSSNYQWSLHSTGQRALLEADINIPQAWDITTGSPDSIIAIISTGIQIQHPDLKSKIWTNPNEIPGNGIDDDKNGCVDDLHGCEFFDGEANPDPNDPLGWGTFTCGIAAAETNNEVGMAGISWGAKCMPVKVLRLLPGNVLGGFISDLITGIQYAVTNGAHIIHLGPRVEDGSVSEDKLQLLQAAITDAVEQGALVIAGTGDLGEPRLLYPAGFSNVVAVGATGLQNERTWFSNYGEGMDLVAPGELILSTCDNRQYCVGRGTSLAAAHVDGVASLIWSVNPHLSAAQVRQILQESASDLGPRGYDAQFGYGQLDAGAAIAQTPHALWLQTANSDPSRLIFLLDTQARHACQIISNRGTGPQTWRLQPESEWMIVDGPNDPPQAPVPSNARVCVDVAAFATTGYFEGILKASSTLSPDTTVDVQVKTIYHMALPRVRLGLIQRP